MDVHMIIFVTLNILAKSHHFPEQSFFVAFRFEIIYNVVHNLLSYPLRWPT